ncbi:hypothetical protein FQN60_009750, partial [Etheostoma spectabile]
MTRASQNPCPHSQDEE